VAGQLVPGFLGDVVVVDRVDADPYRNLIRATEANIRLVVIRGEPLYGDEPALRAVKTYPGSPAPDGGMKAIRRYEVLSETITGVRRKAVDVINPEVENGLMSVSDLSKKLADALRFDRQALQRKIAAAQVRADLKTCRGVPEPSDPPSAEDFDRFLRCRFPGGLPSTPLDALFTPRDGEFFRRLEANPNLPAELKQLRDYYRNP
jgi:hypothetical protein